MLRVKLPRKLKKFGYRRYGRASRYFSFYPSVYPSDSRNIPVACKIMDYVYCINEASRGYKPSWPEIVNHRKYRVISK